MLRDRTRSADQNLTAAHARAERHDQSLADPARQRQPRVKPAARRTYLDTLSVVPRASPPATVPASVSFAVPLAHRPGRRETGFRPTFGGGARMRVPVGIYRACAGGRGQVIIRPHPGQLSPVPHHRHLKRKQGALAASGAMTGLGLIMVINVMKWPDNVFFPASSALFDTGC
jgi:hypothetical protein